MPKVSIIVPVFKVEEYIDRCIKSVINQNFQDWELILIDDGSPDRSGDVCDNYAYEESRIRVIHKTNCGVSSARNTGIEAALGDWIVFLDADDWIEPECVAACYSTCIKFDLDLLQFGFCSINADTKQNRSAATTSVLDYNGYVEKGSVNLTVWASFFKNDIIKYNDVRFNTDLRLAEDQLFVFSYMKYSKRMMYLDTPYYMYFNNTNSAVYRAKSTDMLKSAGEIKSFLIDGKISNKFLEHTFLFFIIKLILSNDVDLAILRSLYNNSIVSLIACKNNYEKLFYMVSRLSFNIASLLVRQVDKFKPYN